MNDRYKLRAWDISNKIMHNDFQFIKSGDNGNDWIIFQSDKQKLDFDKEKNFCINIYPNPYFAEQLKIMQCTGLKDENGKLIYEGDIVEVQYIGDQIPLFRNKYIQNPKTERFEIYCHEKWLRFYAKNDNYQKICEIHSLDLDRILINTYNKIYTIIGNIYENPELLME